MSTVVWNGYRTQWPRVGSLIFEVVYGLSYVSPALRLLFTLMKLFRIFKLPRPLGHGQTTDSPTTGDEPTASDLPTPSDLSAASKVPTAGGVPAASDVPVAASSTPITSSHPIGAEILVHGADPITAEWANLFTLPIQLIEFWVKHRFRSWLARSPQEHMDQGQRMLAPRSSIEGGGFIAHPCHYFGIRCQYSQCERARIHEYPFPALNRFGARIVATKEKRCGESDVIVRKFTSQIRVARSPYHLCHALSRRTDCQRCTPLKALHLWNSQSDRLPCRHSTIPIKFWTPSRILVGSSPLHEV